MRAIAWLDQRPRTLIGIVAASGVAGIVCLPLLGARLLPDFRENYLIAHASLRPGISLPETARVGAQISKGLMAIPGVKSVAEQIGRAENGQDPDAPNKSEFEVQIDPQARAQRERDRCRDPRCVRRLPEPARGNLFGAGRAHRRDAVRRVGAVFDQRDRLRSRRRRPRRCADRRRAAAPARQRQRPPDGSAARGGTARGTRARAAGRLRPAGGGCAADDQCGLSRQPRRPNSTRRIAACRWWCASRTPAPIRKRWARCCCAGGTER